MLRIKNKGISIIEVLVVISILSIISAIVVPRLSGFRNQQVLKNTTEDIVSLLNEARNNTISSKDSTNYGVRFESDKVVLFRGLSFDSSTVNKEIKLDPSVTIPEEGGINLQNGGGDIIFERITGDTVNDEYGTIVIQSTKDENAQNIISISKIGIIDSN